MFELVDKFLDFFLDVYICNSIGLFSIIVIIIFSLVEGILISYYFKEKKSTLEDVKIYSLLVFRLIVFVSTICFRWWLAFILSCFAVFVSKKSKNVYMSLNLIIQVYLFLIRLQNPSVLKSTQNYMLV